MQSITEMLNCRYPIIQGAMGVICNPEFVAAVSEAGGFGLLATAFSPDPESVRDQIRATKKITDKPFGANLQVMNPQSVKIADVLSEEGVHAVTLSGGSPKALLPVLKEKNIKVLVIVPDVDVARKAEILGADAVIAEGAESGGIQSLKSVSTMVLTPAVVDAVSIPVIAAGGIADSRGYKAALALGAKGVQVGTRFIATKECIAHENYKNVLVQSSVTGTALVNAGRFSVRNLRTPLVERILNNESPNNQGFGDEGLDEAWIKGDLEAATLPAGEVAGLIYDVKSVKEIIDEMIS